MMWLTIEEDVKVLCEGWLLQYLLVAETLRALNGDWDNEEVRIVDDDRATYLSQWAISWGRQNGQSETSMTHNIEFVFLPTGCAR